MASIVTSLALAACGGATSGSGAGGASGDTPDGGRDAGSVDASGDGARVDGAGGSIDGPRDATTSRDADSGAQRPDSGSADGAGGGGAAADARSSDGSMGDLPDAAIPDAAMPDGATPEAGACTVAPDIGTGVVVVSPTTGLVTTESGSTATFTVVLGSAPAANVMLELFSSRPETGTVSPSSLTFTAANWNAPQPVTVTGVDNTFSDGNQRYEVVTAPTVSSDPRYQGVDPPDVFVSNTDNESPGITTTWSPNPLRTSEGGNQAQFTVVLNDTPRSNVLLSFGSNDRGEGRATPPVLVLGPTNWNRPQTVTVTGVDDHVVDGDQPFTVLASSARSADLGYDGITPNGVNVTNADDDVASLVVDPPAIVTSEAGQAAVFSFVLSSQPIADVRIDVASSDVGEGTVSPTAATFTPENWNAPQRFTVTGVDDGAADGDQPYAITTALTSDDPHYAAAVAPTIEAINLEGDAAPGITVSPAVAAAREGGGAAVFSVILDAPPAGAVSLAVPPAPDADLTTSAATLTFTSANWNVPQTFTALAVDDDVAEAARDISLAGLHATSADPAFDGRATAALVVHRNDDDVAGVTVSAAPQLLTSEAGAQASFTVRLDTAPTANVSFALSGGGFGAFAPAVVVFTPLDWNEPQTVTVSAVDDDVAGIVVSNAGGLTTTEGGGSAHFDVRLRSQPTADVTIRAWSSNAAEGAVAAARLVFTAQNWSVAQTLTVTGLDDCRRDGPQSYFAVIAPALSGDPNYSGMTVPAVSVTNTDDD